jgi:iron complex transport system substrate-binding protein
MFQPIRLIIIALSTFWLITSCTNNTSVETNLNPECRPIQHTMGETCVPLEPQRVIALGGTTLESALVMDVGPLAAQTDVLPHLESKLEGIEILGWPLNLERVVALKPDLIIGSANGQEQDTYDLLTQIAPTVLANPQTSGDWQEVVRFVGQVLGKPENANQVLADYQGRIDNLQQRLGGQLQNIEVSVVRLYPDKIGVYLKDSFIGKILADVGFGRPPAQELNANQALAAIGNPIQKSISKERLIDADGDVIFVVVYNYQPQIEKELQTTLKELQADPLWSRLEAVQQEQVYPVGSHWLVSGPLAAQVVIDDLFQYLVNN